MARSKTEQPVSSRRNALTLLGAAGALAVVGLRATAAAAQAKAAGGQELPHVADTDPTAKALGYTEDASKVDKTKFTTYKAGSKCSLCNFFQGTAGAAYGPCQIFPGKSVNANGWCASFSAKAK